MSEQTETHREIEILKLVIGTLRVQINTLTIALALKCHRDGDKACGDKLMADVFAALGGIPQ